VPCCCLAGQQGHQHPYSRNSRRPPVPVQAPRPAHNHGHDAPTRWPLQRALAVLGVGRSLSADGLIASPPVSCASHPAAIRQVASSSPDGMHLLLRPHPWCVSRWEGLGMDFAMVFLRFCC
jgi:hypothetical protein